MRINKNNIIYNNFMPKENKIADRVSEQKKNVNINISDTGKKLAKKVAEIDNVGYSERVEAIRKSVLSGTYKTSSENIADKIIQKFESGEI